MAEQYLKAFNLTGKNRNKEKVLEALQKRTFNGQSILTYVVDSPNEVANVLLDGVKKLCPSLDKEELINKIKSLQVHQCIWDYYLMAFYDSTYSQVPEKSIEFGAQSFYEAFESGLGFYINLGSLAIGVMLPEAYRDEQMRIHRSNGPAIIWGAQKDYWWHGVKVPSEWIENKDAIDPTLVLMHPNIEERRCLAEIIGWDRVLEKMKPKVLDVDGDPQIVTLLEVDLPDHGPQRFLRVVEESTGRQFSIMIPQEAKTALQAQSLINQIPEDLLRLPYV